jgi:hypothetical protein
MNFIKALNPALRLIVRLHYIEAITGARNILILDRVLRTPGGIGVDGRTLSCLVSTLLSSFHGKIPLYE